MWEKWEVAIRWALNLQPQDLPFCALQTQARFTLWISIGYPTRLLIFFPSFLRSNMILKLRIILWILSIFSQFVCNFHQISISILQCCEGISKLEPGETEYMTSGSADRCSMEWFMTYGVIYGWGSRPTLLIKYYRQICLVLIATGILRGPCKSIVTCIHYYY